MTVGDSEAWLKHSDHAPPAAEWDDTHAGWMHASRKT